MNQTPDRRDTPSLAIRILWTLLLVAISLAGTWVVLPGIDREALLGLAHRAGSSTDTASLSVVALGLMPFMTGAFLVEVFALIIPRYRPLRYGGLPSRQRLHRAALWVTLIIAVIQSYLLVSWLRTEAYAGASWLPSLWIAGLGVLPVLLLMLTLTAGVFALLALARGIERLGIGSGVSMLIAGGQLWAWGRRLTSLPESTGDLPTPVAFGLAVLLIGAVMLTTVLIVRKRTSAGRLPLCGLTPLGIVASLALLAAPLALFNLSMPSWLHHIPSEAMAALVFSLGVGFSLLLFREEWLPLDKTPERAEPWVGAAISAGYLLGLLVAQRLIAQLVGGNGLDLLAVAVVTAVAVDLKEEGAFRTAHGPLGCVWTSHSVAAADAAVAALYAAGIPALARGVCHRSLWRFFGPHLELDLLVPWSQAEAALRILNEGPERVLGSGAPLLNSPAPPRDPMSPSARRALWLVPTVLFLGAGAVLVGRYAPTAEIVLAAELGQAVSPVAREAALAHDVEVLKQRLHSLKIWPSWVHSSDGHILIRLPQRTSDELSALITTLTSNARLEFKLAEVGGDYLGRVSAAAAQQQAQYPGLKAEHTSFYRPGSGTGVADDHVTAPDRAVLLRFLNELPPLLQPASDREFVLEAIQPRDEEAPTASYRTHLLHRAAAVTGRDIENAELTLDRNTSRYSVALTFTADGGQRFGDFTAAHIGDRLAIVVNGEVSSAPVIQSAIYGGHAQLTLGMKSPLAQHEEAQLLAALLRSGALTVPLRVISAH